MSSGSSPRLRGTALRLKYELFCPRFIPAPAGNRMARFVARHVETVHPRACGEQHGNAVIRDWYTGSSPRLRGTDPRVLEPPNPSRFIPAPAGNRPLIPTRTQARPVHPRACGEQSKASSPPDSPDGSSPRLRGTVLHPPPRIDHFRFIPAPAGNSAPSTSTNRSLSVHPRACGEQLSGLVGFHSMFGSSPRLRGTVIRQHPTNDPSRFIPAPAGNRLHPRSWARTVPVHPRACGEQMNQLTFASTSSGSSPRLRGTDKGNVVVGMLRRFIPAPAGNSPPSSRSPRLRPVHPRACGEQNWQVRVTYNFHGSSPRLRGTVDSSVVSDAIPRFIPAPAGNSRKSCRP